MKVILRSDVEKLGRAGDVKEVKPGFGRNYLIPNRLAMLATPAALRFWEKGKERRAKLAAEQRAKAVEQAAKLAGVNLPFSRPAGPEGRLFGSVGKTDIVKGLKAAGHEVDRTAVRIDEPVKTVGEHEIELRLQPDVTAKIKVTITPRE